MTSCRRHALSVGAIQTLQVQDVMSRDVVVVFEFTLFKDIVELTERVRVSTFPVIDHRRPVGIVSESDLLLKADQNRIRPRRWPQISGQRRAEDRKAHAVCARTLMTSPVIVIGPDASTSEAAQRMLAHRYVGQRWHRLEFMATALKPVPIRNGVGMP
jgi:CBS-domain-containing membrane protein